jgi:type I restriction enzyme S subunit
MSEWKEIYFGDLVSLKRGHDLPAKDRRPGKVPVIGSGGIAGWHDTPIVQGPGITIGRAANLGVPVLTESDFWPLNTTLYVTDFHGNDVYFIYYLIKTIDFTGFNSGSVQPMLNRNYIKNYQIRVPYVKEQRRIASLLGALDDKIATNNLLVSAIDKLCEALLIGFMRGRPVRHLPLRSISLINHSSVKSRSEGHLRYIDISSVTKGRVEWPELSPWGQAPGRARRKVSWGDTIWSTVRPERKSYALIMSDDPHIVASTGFVVLTPTQVGPAFLYEVTKRDEFVSYLTSVAEGSAYPAVRPERFAEAIVPVPSPDELNAFESQAISMRQRAFAAEMESRALAQLRDSLLPGLMSGAIRVRDAEKAVEEAL